jgi:hypothetical protein
MVIEGKIALIDEESEFRKNLDKNSKILCTVVAGILCGRQS